MTSGTSTTAGLSGMEQRGLAGGHVKMNERKMVALSGVLVALAAAISDKVDAVVQHSRWIGGRWLRQPHTRQASRLKGAPDWWVPHTRQASWLGPQVLDVRFGCESV